MRTDDDDDDKKRERRMGRVLKGPFSYADSLFPCLLDRFFFLLYFFLSITEKGEGQFRSFVRVAKGKKRSICYESYPIRVKT